MTMSTTRTTTVIRRRDRVRSLVKPAILSILFFIPLLARKNADFIQKMVLESLEDRTSSVETETKKATSTTSSTPYSSPADNRRPESNEFLPEIAWLISFPNSGTSYTINLVSSITDTSTTTNYAFEKMITNTPKPLYPSIHPNGPFIKLDKKKIPHKYSMTKTHCTGYNTEGNIQTYIVNRKQFVKGCAKIHWKENGVVRFSQYDDRILPKRAIRLVRDPFDNVVSNYNHWVQNQMKKDDKLKDYNSDEERFQAYCVRHNNSFKQKMKDENIEIFKDEEMKEMLKEVPCHQHFFRYVQWHNNANHLANHMDILLIHYDDYETKFNETMNGLLGFLELDLAVKEDDIPLFKSGKTYRDYYSEEQKKMISRFVRYVADRETIELISAYLID